MPFQRDSVPRVEAENQGRLQHLRERAMQRVRAEEQATGSTRREVLRGFGFALAGAVPVVAALAHTQAALAERPVGPRGAAPQYGAPWIEPPTIPYTAPDRLAARNAEELADSTRWDSADVVFVTPGRHAGGWQGEGISHARKTSFQPHGSGQAYSLVVVGDSDAKRASLLHGGWTVYVRASDGLRGYKWDGGVMTGMRALGSVEWTNGNDLDPAIEALAGKVDARLVQDRGYDLPSIDLRRPELAGIFPSAASEYPGLSGASLDHGKLTFGVSEWNKNTQQSRLAYFTVDMEANRLVGVTLNNEKLALS